MAADVACGWPSAEVLEKWLMTSTRDADDGARFLRRIVNINPGYGSYLSSSEELAMIIQRCAKVVRRRVVQPDAASSSNCLYEPLCGLAWRVVGHIMHTIIELQDQKGLPVPHAAGQVRMLLETNETLSRQLKESRRAYLKELVALRDTRRKLTTKQQSALQSLQEEPIMFYEPLNYILDESTKAFVNEVVEERIKLGFMNMLQRQDEEEGDEADADEEDVQELRMQISRLKVDNRRCMQDASRAMEKAKRLEESEKAARGELVQQTQVVMRLQEELDALRAQRANVKEEVSSLEAASENVNTQASPSPRSVHIDMDPVLYSDPDSDPSVSGNPGAESPVALMRQPLAKPKPEVRKEMQRQRMSSEMAIQSDASPRSLETVKEIERVVERVVEVVKEDPELRKQLDMYRANEAQLRKAVADLEKSLNAEIAAKERLSADLKQHTNRATTADVSAKTAKVEASARATESTGDKVKRAKKGTVQPQVSEDLAPNGQAIGELERQNQQLQDELERLRAQLASAQGESKMNANQHIVGQAGRATSDSQNTETEAWKDRYTQLQLEHENLEIEHERLKKKLALLLDNLQQQLGQDALDDTLAEIQLERPSSRRHKRDVVWRRLYRDAQRRMQKGLRTDVALSEEEQRLIKQLPKHRGGSFRGAPPTHDRARVASSFSPLFGKQDDGEPSDGDEQDEESEDEDRTGICIACGRALDARILQGEDLVVGQPLRSSSTPTLLKQPREGAMFAHESPSRSPAPFTSDAARRSSLFSSNLFVQGVAPWHMGSSAGRLSELDTFRPVLSPPSITSVEEQEPGVSGHSNSSGVHFATEGHVPWMSASKAPVMGSGMQNSTDGAMDIGQSTVLNRTTSTGALHPPSTPKRKLLVSPSFSPPSQPLPPVHRALKPERFLAKGASLSGDAGTPPFGLALRFHEPQLPASGRDASAACLGSWFDQKQRTSDRTLSRKLTHKDNNLPFAGSEVPGNRFFVVPLVSQQSLAAGLPPPVGVPR